MKTLSNCFFVDAFFKFVYNATICTFLLISLNSCKSDVWNGEIVVKNGVTHVSNEGASVQEAASFTLRRQWTVGGKGTSYRGHALHLVRGVAVSEGGDVYVSDGGNGRILHCTETGTLSGSIGASGNGPGEFQNLGGIALRKDTLFALDTGKRQVSLFHIDGMFLQGLDVRIRAAGIAVRDSVILIPRFSFSEEDPLVVAYTLRGKRVDGLVTPLEPTPEVVKAGEVGTVASTRDGFFFAFAYPYQIERWADGARRAVITLEHDSFVAPTSPQQKEEMTLGGRLPSKIRGIGVLGNGRFLVQVTHSDAPPELHLFSEEGKILTRISLPKGHQLGAVEGRNVYTFIHGGTKAPAQVAKWTLSRQE